MKKIIAVGFVYCLILSSCTVPVHLDPVPRIYVKEKIKCDVGLFIDQSQIMIPTPQSGLCLIGMANTWNVETGRGLYLGAERTFRSIFTNVEILKEIKEFTNKPLTLLITPKVQMFNISQDLAADLMLYCKLVNRVGETVYENTIPAKGESQAATGFCLGFWGGETALSKTSNDAFNKAFAFLADDIIKKVDFTPYQSR
jgi:hypothetical protein